MAELNMQGEHHVNTFLGHEKKKKEKKKHKPGRTLLLHACLDFSLIRCWPHLPNQKQSASGEAKPGPFGKKFNRNGEEK